MKIAEIELEETFALLFHAEKVALIERLDCHGRNDCLAMRFTTGIHLKLLSAVDVSEQLCHPRVISIEASTKDAFVLFGGEKVYWLAANGNVVAELPLFRKWAEAEYWTTKILENKSRTILIYEAGVLVIDDFLHVLCHKQKLLNDEFVAHEGNTLKFTRDHDVEWLMDLQ